MTDLATKAGAADDAASPDGTTITASGAPGVADAGGPHEPPVQWAPVEPQPRKSRKALWIGIPVGLAVVGVGVASLVLIAPGVSIAGVSVGGLTAGGAADAVTARLAETTIVLTGPGGDAEVTGADLGATIDAQALANEAYAQHPLWNISAWNPEPIDAAVTIDDATATEALRAAAPGSYEDPIDATLTLDEDSGKYVVTDSVLGTGIDVDAVRTALAGALAAGERTVTIEATPIDVVAQTPTYVAESGATIVNRIIAKAGFYVGSERTVPIDPDVMREMLTVGIDDRGAVTISADAADIAPLMKGLPEAVNREAVNSKAIVNKAGTVLEEAAPGATGRALEDTDGIPADFAEQLAQGNGVFQLPVTETPFDTVNVVRLLEVDLGDQMLYLKENDKVVDSWYISSGKGTTPTFIGEYTINAHVPLQTMRGREKDNQGNYMTNPDGTPVMYETPDVPWITYFNGDQAFHGVYWHSNWGSQMSHGCVGMPIERAKQVYEWSSNGTDVWIHG